MMMTVRLFAARAALFIALLLSGRDATAFEAQSTWGGVAGGTANAITVSIANVQSLNDLLGVPIRFIPLTDNTGPVTVVVGGTAARPLLRPSSIGLVALSGAEIKQDEPTSIVFAGAAYILSSNVDMTAIGRTVEFRGAATPRGTLIEDGSCVSRATFAALFAVISTSYGICDGATMFGLPDSRGTSFAALDIQGANGAANRITSAGSGCDATAIGLCGSQNRTISATYLPASGLSVPGLSVPGLSVPGLSVPGLSIPSLTVSASFNQNALAVPVQGFAQTGSSVATKVSQGSNNGGAFSLSLDGAIIGVSGTTLGGTTSGGTTSGGTTSGGTTSGGTTGNMGSGTAFPVLNPISLGRRAIKY